jgi:formylglycine-generating enzyme required for sulfatase activity
MGGPSEEACRKILGAVEPGKPCCPMLREGFGDAQPSHEVEVDGFWMDAAEVTNTQFRKFVEATGYVTVAERKPKAEDLPGVLEEALVPGSLCFRRPLPDADLRDHRSWWAYVRGANWRQPEGPGSDLAGKDNLPVVHVAYEDAAAYAKWSGKRLPTEAEWERAARGGKEGETYPWGDEFRPGGTWMANTWQGRFPMEDTGEDGWKGLAPVRQYRPNPYGLYDLSGNVGEWCADRPGGFVGPGGTGRKQAGASRGILPLLRPVLCPLYSGDEEQGRGQHRDESSGFSVCPRLMGQR